MQQALWELEQISKALHSCVKRLREENEFSPAADEMLREAGDSVESAMNFILTRKFSV